jgi:hypothetical protein
VRDAHAQPVREFGPSHAMMDGSAFANGYPHERREHAPVAARPT